MGNLSADDIVYFGAVLDRQPKKIVEIKKWQPKEKRKLTMNLTTLTVILDRASVPYKHKYGLYELQIFANRAVPAAKISTMYPLRGFIDYEELSDWYVPEKARLIATAANAYLQTPEEKREADTLDREVFDRYCDIFQGPMLDVWKAPEVVLLDGAEVITESWYKRLVYEYYVLYNINAKLGQRIDKNYCTEKAIDDQCYLAAMIDQFEATKQVLKAMEKRIMVVNDYKVKIKKYIDLPVYQK